LGEKKLIKENNNKSRREGGSPGGVKEMRKKEKGIITEKNFNDNGKERKGSTERQNEGQYQEKEDKAKKEGNE